MIKLPLTDTERLILANQYEILGQLKEDDSYTRLASNLRDGHEWIYRDKFQLSEILPSHDATHVLNILGIYSDLKSSYEALGNKDGIDEHQTNFPGFDGNNEGEFLHFAQALSDDGRYHITVGDHARNSHSPTTEMYERMIQEWMRLGKPLYPFSKDQIESILDARIHPSNRS